MGGPGQSVRNEAAAEGLHAPLQGQIDPGTAPNHTVHRVQVLTAGQVGRAGRELARAQEHNRQPFLWEPRATVSPDIFKQPQTADDGRGVYGRSLALVVQTGVSTHHRHSQRSARPCHAANGLLELVVDLRPLRVAKVEAVGERQGFRADAGQVARNFRDDHLRAAIGIEEALTAVAVDGHRDGLAGVLDPEDCSVSRARRDHRVGLDLVIILAVHTLPAGYIGSGHQL